MSYAYCVIVASGSAACPGAPPQRVLKGGDRRGTVPGSAARVSRPALWPLSSRRSRGACTNPPRLALLWLYLQVSCTCTDRLLVPDGPPLSERHVSDALQAAFAAGDGSVATIGDVLRAAAAAVPRDVEGVDPQFLSTLALDSINQSMLMNVVALSDSMTANAAIATSEPGRKRTQRPP